MTIGHQIGPFRVSPHTRNGKKTGRWLVSIPKSFDGKRRRRFFPNRQLADQYAKSIDEKYRKGTLSQNRRRETVRMTFRQVVEEWRRFDKMRVATNKKREISYKTDGYRLRVILRILGDDTPSEIGSFFM